jgi:hypothetical protein
MFFWVMAAVVVQAVGTLALAQSCGICPQGNESGAVGDFPQSLLAAQTYPIGNPPLTYAALSVVGATGQDDEREFLLSLGLVSNRGNQVTFSCAYNSTNFEETVLLSPFSTSFLFHLPQPLSSSSTSVFSQSRPTPYHDKVTLYAGIEGHAGTGDIWAINPLVTQTASSGDYNAQVCSSPHPESASQHLHLFLICCLSKIRVLSLISTTKMRIAEMQMLAMDWRRRYLIQLHSNRRCSKCFFSGVLWHVNIRCCALSFYLCHAGFWHHSHVESRDCIRK